MKRILIVDDHADIRRLIRMTLEFEDYEVHEAADAPAAVAAAAELKPDLVRLDVMLLSARGQASDREAGLRAGADAYLIKPFSPLQLISSIAGLWVAACGV